MNYTDNTKYNFICYTTAAHGQATALANISLIRNKSQGDLKTLLLRSRELLKHLDYINRNHWELVELVASLDLASVHV